MPDELLLCSLSGGVFKLEGSVLFISLHLFPIFGKLSWLKDPRRDVGRKFDLKVLQAELILISCFDLLPAGLLDCEFGNNCELFFREEVFTFFILLQSDE